jgi:Myb-like DNA-binding domain
MSKKMHRLHAAGKAPSPASAWTRAMSGGLNYTIYNHLAISEPLWRRWTPDEDRALLRLCKVHKNVVQFSWINISLQMPMARSHIACRKRYNFLKAKAARRKEFLTITLDTEFLNWVFG